LPSDLYEKYHGQGGLARMEFDMEVATEISRQIADSQSKGKNEPRGGIKGVVARRNQLRKQASQNAVSDEQAVNMLMNID